MNKVASPCIRNCCLDEQDICMGCFRTLEEIKNWQQASIPEKEHILCLARKRRFKTGKNFQPNL